MDNIKKIPLKTPNFIGYKRHFPSATSEWSNSIYSHYKNNDIKSLPMLDNIFFKLIKIYSDNNFVLVLMM